MIRANAVWIGLIVLAMAIFTLAMLQSRRIPPRLS